MQGEVIKKVEWRNGPSTAPNARWAHLRMHATSSGPPVCAQSRWLIILYHTRTKFSTLL